MMVSLFAWLVTKDSASEFYVNCSLVIVHLYIQSHTRDNGQEVGPQEAKARSEWARAKGGRCLELGAQGRDLFV